MTRARKHLVCISDTPYYHITSRCVRRAFLCGLDKETGKNYEHRRAWIESRIRVLSSLFCIDVCAYAVMSNHYHLVVKLNPDGSSQWSDDEVLERWTALFRGPLLVQHYSAGIDLSEAEQEALRSIINVYRTRLSSLSWFMKCLNEPIARKANAEDQCTGHFWEARFHSEPLFSEQTIIAAMAYVDLNPIRAKLAKTPEDSDYTSIKVRVSGEHQGIQLREAILQMLKSGELNHFNARMKPLMGFWIQKSIKGFENKRTQPGELDRLPIYAREYFSLVDMTGRILTRGKRGRIDPNLESILERLNLSNDQWIQVSSGFNQYYRNGYLRIKQVA